MPEIEYSRKVYEIKALDEDGRFEGVASVYGNIDSYRDVVEKGAFAKTITERGSRVPILAEHKDTIGSGDVFDAGTHLGVRGRILMTVQKGREYVELAKAGVVRGLSIGYRTIKEEFDATRKVRRLLEVKLYEVSLVTFPANELATIKTTGPADDSTAASDAEVLQALREIRRGNPLTQALRELQREMTSKRGRAA
jgi:hypothetical protein